MKLIIQIPCFNEEKTLPIVVASLPKKITGIDSIEVLIINDGSTDSTLAVARELGVNHIVDLHIHRGLAEAFRRGMEVALEKGADIIVNTDADNQYPSEEIARLIQPILSRKAEIVVGCRDIFAIKHFSPIKKLLQKFGSFIVRKFSHTDIPDTTSGFRAYSREAALRLNVFTNYTYTLETIIQAGIKEIPISYITIKTNEKTRESRLIKSIRAYIVRSMATILRIYLLYEPLKFFIKIGSLFLGAALVLGVRYMYIFIFASKKSGHVQSLILTAILALIGVQLMITGLLADTIAANRRLLEELQYRQRKEQFNKRAE